jgi:hypothetical protein
MMSRRALAPGLALVGLVVLLAGGAVITGDRGTPSASSTTTPGGTSASASEDPHALTVADVTRSLQENAGFMPLANFENLRITISPSGDEVDLDARPNLVLDEHSFLLQAGSDALVAAKAIIGWYPTVLQVGVTLEGTFRDAGGGSSVQPGVSADPERRDGPGLVVRGGRRARPQHGRLLRGRVYHQPGHLERVERGRPRLPGGADGLIAGGRGCRRQAGAPARCSSAATTMPAAPSNPIRPVSMARS